MPPQKPYTFAIPTSQRSDQKLQKSMSCQRTGRNETCSKFERKIYGNE